MDTYVCALCKKSYTKTLTEEEAKANWERDFPDLPFDETDRVLVCDDCYNQHMLRAQASPEELAKAQKIADDFAKVFAEANQQLVKMGMSPLPMPDLSVPPREPGSDGK